MALSKLVTNTNETIKVIARQDSAISPELSDETWNMYVETLDEALLELSSVPTRFVMKMRLSYDAQIKVQNAQVGVEDGRAEIKIGFMVEEVRLALTDIENPAGAGDFLFKREKDGFASKELIAELAQYGIVSQLYSARAQALSRVFQPTKK
jgi:hypothetical protein